MSSHARARAVRAALLGGRRSIRQQQQNGLRLQTCLDDLRSAVSASEATSEMASASGPSGRVAHICLSIAAAKGLDLALHVFLLRTGADSCSIEFADLVKGVCTHAQQPRCKHAILTSYADATLKDQRAVCFLDILWII